MNLLNTTFLTSASSAVVRHSRLPRAGVGHSRLSAPSPPPPPPGGGSTFTDTPGDSGTAPDIGSVTISNDANGQIAMQIGIANAPTLAADMVVGVLLDTDQNPATGAPGVGFDYAILIASQGYALAHWDGSIRLPVL